MRCGENIDGTQNLLSYNKEKNRATDSIICVGQAKNNIKEQDGDSGGPLLTKVGSDYVQIGVNTGSAFADGMRDSGKPGDTHIGFYTAVNWKTIKPWLEKILEGNIAEAEAMTCASLGGPTAPQTRRLRSEEEGTRSERQLLQKRTLLSGPTTQASAGEYPYMTTFGTLHTGNGIWEAGCDGTVINSNTILTAAHCFEYDEFKTNAGIWPGAFNFTAVSKYTANFSKATKVLRHPCYTLANGGSPACLSAGGCMSTNKPSEDIAVAILEKNTTATPVKLLGYGSYASTTLTFPVTTTMAGWGRYCDPALDNSADQCTRPDVNEVTTGASGGSGGSGGSSNNTGSANAAVFVSPSTFVLGMATLLGLTQLMV